jgi:hypothetical protein
MAIQRHDRKEMALSQLESGLRLYFDREYYSAITLGGAADEIFGQLLRVQGKEPSIESIKRAVAEIFEQTTGRALDPKRVAHRANHARNSLKHWNDGDELVVEFDALEEARDMLDRAISNYWQLQSQLSPAMERFQRELSPA